MEIGTVEYRVRPVTRYVVTRFEGNANGIGPAPVVKGEYPNAEMAYEVGTALCRDEHARLGLMLGDERIRYPRPLDESEFVHTVATSRAWMETAAQFSRNEDFYRDLLRQIGEMFGDEAFRSDDGSLQDSVLALKVPGLVARALADRRRPLTGMSEREFGEIRPEVVAADD